MTPQEKQPITHEKMKHVVWFDQALHSTLTVVAIILFVICLSLVVLGLVELVRGWGAMFGQVALIGSETISSIFITGLGLIVIGIAVLDLTKSILDEEIADKKMKNTQERARDFLNRFLPVIIFAISAEIFVTLAQSENTEVELFSNVAMMGIAVGAMLVGLAVYLKLTSEDYRENIPKMEV